MPSEVPDQRELLRPYLPRLLTFWLHDTPEASFEEIEGSIAFVDISGFTKLSERLAKRGKVGAEELTETIGGCFARLLGVAYGNNGGLIKFGGDALLLLFNGDDHAERAARAAIGMRKALREIGSLRTPGGRVTLRMSVGVHSGTFHFFLVGSSHRELVITGPAATETVTMESTAEAGEIVVSASTAAALPAAVIGSPKGAGFLLRKEPPGVFADRGTIDCVPTADQMLSCIPVAVREHVLAAVREPEHRRVTVAFVHFDGTDALIAERGSEAAAQALGALVETVQRSADRHGVSFLGTDIDKNGGKIILSAGAPTASGNDEERMLLAVREIMDADQPVSIRIGVNRGEVFAGDIGPYYRQTYTVMGDAVNLAARLMAKAEAGQIVATPAVLDPSRTPFRRTAMEPFFVKGKSMPIHAFLVGPIEEARASDRRASMPLIGREREIGIMMTAAAAARDGRGSVVEIIGEPGIGKSRLIEELESLCSDMSQIAVACELYHASIPYSALVEPLRRLFGIGMHEDVATALPKLRSVVERVDPSLLPWLPLVGIPLDIAVPETVEVAQLEGDFRRQRLQQTMAALVAGVLSGPTLIVVEDGHWMDEASADLLRVLVAGIAERPWVVCLTRRDVPDGVVLPEGPGVEIMRPQPLDETAAAALVDAMTEESPLAPHDIAALAERSGGNPLFLKELLAAAREAGSIEGLPESVGALISARIDRLPTRERTVLKRLSVLGPTFHGELARAVIPPDLDDAGEETWRRLEEFIAPDGADGFRFRHALIHDAAYEALPYRLRRELHATVGQTIEREAGRDVDEFAPILSLHFFNAHRYDAAWRYSRMAGERAEKVYANIEAADFYVRALEAAKHECDVPVNDLVAVQEALGDLRNRIGEFPKALAAYRAARRLAARDPVIVARVYVKEADIRRVAGRFVEADRTIRTANRSLEGADGADAARIRAQLYVVQAAVRRAQGRSRDTIKWCLKVVESEVVDKEVLAHAYYLMDNAYFDLGVMDEVRYSSRALELYEELGDLKGQGVVLNNLGTRAYWMGRWNEALELYDRGRAAREKIGDAVNATYGTANIGEILLDQGRLEEAEPYIKQALRVWRPAGNYTKIAFATSLLGRLAARSGLYDDALTLLDEARAAAAHAGAEPDMIDIDSKIAECLCLKGDADAAQAVALKALEAGRTVPYAAVVVPPLHRAVGWAHAQLGDLVAARASFEESLRVARSRKADFEIALTLRALAALDRVEGRTVEHGAFNESRSILERLGVVRVFEPAALALDPEPSVLGAGA